MKTPRHLIALLALGVVTTATAVETKPAGAQPAAAPRTLPAPAPEWAELFGDVSLAVVWQSATAAVARIESALQAKRFTGVADWAETVHLAAHALEDQVKLADAEAQKRLKAALEQAARIADDVLDAAHHEDGKQLADSFRRMSAALKLAASRLPAEITRAAPQEPRFAKAAGHSHDDKGGHGHK